MAVTATRWTALENKLKENLSSTSDANATSLGSGLNGPGGTDICASVYLGGTRHLLLAGDTIWPPTSGLTRAQALGATNGFVRNALGYISGSLDPTAATITWYTGASPTAYVQKPFFQDQHGDCPDGQEPWGRYPMCGIKLGNYVLVVGMYHVADESGPFNTVPVRTWAQRAYDNGLAPNTWTWEEVKVDIGTQQTGGKSWHYMGGGLVEHEQHVIAWGHGPWDSTGHWAVGQFNTLDAREGSLIRSEWWDGTSFKPESRSLSRADVLPTGFVAADQAGAVCKRSDGQFFLSIIPQTWLSADPRVYYGLRTTPGGAFTMTEVYDIPLGTNEFCYQALPHPNFTWGGKAATDIAVGYSRNTNSLAVLSDARTYWPEFLQLAGFP